MGEYAKIKGTGERVKIGTCEDMLYLRADQARRVWAQPGNVDPVADADRGIRFRFPWPDEDDIAPGAFDDPFRALVVPGLEVPEGVEHGLVQFSATPGYLVSLPCPEGPGILRDGDALRVHRNGFPGAVELVQQRYYEGRLVAVCQCRGCGRAYRLPTLADAEPLIVAVRAMADREHRVAEQNGTPGNAATGDRYHEIAERITAGYDPERARAHFERAGR